MSILYMSNLIPGYVMLNNTNTNDGGRGQEYYQFFEKLKSMIRIIGISILKQAGNRNEYGVYAYK